MVIQNVGPVKYQSNDFYHYICAVLKMQSRQDLPTSLIRLEVRPLTILTADLTLTMNVHVEIHNSIHHQFEYDFAQTLGG